MKQSKFKISYSNSTKREFSAANLFEAILKATNEAINQGESYSIDEIEDEDKNVYHGISVAVNWKRSY